MRLALARAALATALATAALTAPATAAQAAPQVDAAWVTNVGASSALLHAKVNPNGVATTYHFNYLPEAAYKANLAASQPGFSGALKAPSGADLPLGSGSVDAIAKATVAGLSAETAYRYRIVATGGGSAESAPQAFTTQGLGGASVLLEGRGWEMVSPIEKGGGEVGAPGALFGGGVLAAAAGGGAVTYSSSASFGGDATGAPPASQYLARRSPAGWSSEDLSPPLLSGSYGAEPDGVPYRLFSSDLTSGLMLGGVRCRDAEPDLTDCPVANPPLPGSGALPGYQNYYLKNTQTGTWQALLTAADAPSLTLPATEFSLAFAGASEDLSHVVLATCAKLTPDASEEPVCEAGGPNLYEWSGGSLALVNRLGADPLGSSDAHLAAQSGAISSDGSRVYFTVGEEAALYLREGSAGARPVAEAASFQTASADGRYALYTKAAHLYRYDAQSELSTDLTPSGGVQGVLGAAADSAYVYYQSAGTVFCWHEGTTTEVGAGEPSNYPPASGSARVSADGSHLAFLSKAPLTGYDNTDQTTEAPDTELFLYTAPKGPGKGTLACASCNPTGERPLGPSTISGSQPNGTTNTYKPRNLSADGTRLFFDSQDALVGADTNNRPDAYQWEAPGSGGCAKAAGCIGLLSGGRDGEASEFIDASASGDDAFFLTHASLVPSDPGSVDLYDARVGGGFPVAPAPIACEGDACQSLPPEPEDPAPGTLVVGAPNPPLAFPKQGHKKHHKKHKGHKGHKGGKR
jgi:hypothetical protein